MSLSFFFLALVRVSGNENRAQNYAEHLIVTLSAPHQKLKVTWRHRRSYPDVSSRRK